MTKTTEDKRDLEEITNSLKGASGLVFMAGTAEATIGQHKDSDFMYSTVSDIIDTAVADLEAIQAEERTTCPEPERKRSREVIDLLDALNATVARLNAVADCAFSFESTGNDPRLMGRIMAFIEDSLRDEADSLEKIADSHA